jgi:hypothetical protein
MLCFRVFVVDNDVPESASRGRLCIAGLCDSTVVKPLSSGIFLSEHGIEDEGKELYSSILAVLTALTD